MHYLAFAENILTSAAHDDNDNTTATTPAFDDHNEFPPLSLTDDAWQLVDRNEDEPYCVVQHQQEEDWQCIVDASSDRDNQRKLPLYAQIAEEAAMLPLPVSASQKKRSPPARRPLIPKSGTVSRDNAKPKGMDEEVGDELFSQYKSSNWLRRRYRPRYLHHHAHNQKHSFLRSYHHNHHHHHDHQDPTTANTKTTQQKKNKHTIKRRARAKKQPTRTWMERENGWVPIHAKFRNK
ncbi:hypothetical protein BDB00DRAFT_578864 [Zychaea mexicana]|uniref:uncharacterized protein n=1 Tax=Zychaea mexicana TaxID=64656 RepID=UPI0022FF460A|nr:uncharacterized protein BDB00DRAFT_578864 [Zychaea mexicana]KAI9489902.1 hypothetical protein BDB00DRAFT_578864 [Zychaea mexicana]